MSAGFIAISLLSAGKSLSSQYSEAFAKQVIITLKGIVSQKLHLQYQDTILQGLMVLLAIINRQHQGLSLTVAEAHALLQVPKLGQILQDLSQKYDCSSLVALLTSLVLDSEDQSLYGTFKSELLPFIKGTDLKTNYIIISQILTKLAVVSNIEELEDSKYSLTLSFIQVMKDGRQFNEIVLHYLKQNNFDKKTKHLINCVLSGNLKEAAHSADIRLDQPLSLLNGLSSTKQAIKLNVLNQLKSVGAMGH